MVRKDQCDSFAANPRLADELRRHGVRRVVVAGMQSEYCVLETGPAALGRGFEVVLAAGAHGTYDDGSPAAEISASVKEELRKAGATVQSADRIPFTVAA